jgi:hypothetical protein
LAPDSIFLLAAQCRIDRNRSLSIVRAEQVSVDAQRDVGLGMAKALADRDDIDALIDQLAGVSVPQGRPAFDHRLQQGLGRKKQAYSSAPAVATRSVA